MDNVNFRGTLFKDKNQSQEFKRSVAARQDTGKPVGTSSDEGTCGAKSFTST